MASRSARTTGSLHDDLDEWLLFVRAESHVLEQSPESLFQQAANRAARSAPHRHALAWWESGARTRPWMRRLNPPRGGEPFSIVLAGHEAPIKCCAFSPDGRLIASGSLDGTVRLWDPESGEEVAIALDHRDNVLCCAFSPDGRYLVTGGGRHHPGDQERSYGELRIRDARTLTTLVEPENEPVPIGACAFSPDGNRLAIGSWDGAVRIWRSTTWEELDRLEGHADWSRWLSWVAWSPDGRMLASAAIERMAQAVLYELKGDRDVTELPGSPSSCAFSPDGASLLLWGARLELWSTQSRETQRTLGSSRGLECIAFSPDGRTVSAGYADGTLSTWNLEGESEPASLAAHRSAVDCCAFSPDGRRIVTGSEDCTLLVLDAAALLTHSRHTRPITACDFSPDGGRVATSADDGVLLIRDCGRDREIAICEGHERSVSDCAWSPDGRLVASAGEDAALKVWYADSGRERCTMTGHRYAVTRCAFTPDGDRIVSTSKDRHVKVWDTETGAETADLGFHVDDIQALAISPDGRWAAIASGAIVDPEGEVRLADLATGGSFFVQQRMTQIFSACAFSPDGHRLAVGYRGGVAVWDLFARGYTGVTETEGGIRALAFSPDGRALAAGLPNGDLRILEARTLAPVAAPRGHTVTPYTAYLWPFCIAFSPDGTLLVSADRDGVLKLSDARSGLERMRFFAPRQLRALAIADGGRTIAVGDQNGEVFVLCPMGLSLEPPVATACRLFRHRDRDWARKPTLLCPWCATRREVDSRVTDTIEGIGRAAGLDRADSPIAKLPDEVWEEPRLRTECASCRGALRFNPFIAGDHDNPLP